MGSVRGFQTSAHYSCGAFFPSIGGTGLELLEASGASTSYTIDSPAIVAFRTCVDEHDLRVLSLFLDSSEIPVTTEYDLRQDEIATVHSHSGLSTVTVDISNKLKVQATFDLAMGFTAITLVILWMWSLSYDAHRFVLLPVERILKGEHTPTQRLFSLVSSPSSSPLVLPSQW